MQEDIAFVGSLVNCGKSVVSLPSSAVVEVLSPCKRVEADPSLGALEMRTAEIFWSARSSMRGVGTLSRTEAEESARSKFSSPTERAIPALEEFPSEKSPIASVDDTRPSCCGSSWEPASGTPKTVGRFRDVSHSERRGSCRGEKGSGGQGTITC